MTWVECPNCNKVKRTYSKNFRCCGEQYTVEQCTINYAEYKKGLIEEKELEQIKKQEPNKKSEPSKEDVKSVAPSSDKTPNKEGFDLIKGDDEKLTAEEKIRLAELEADAKKNKPNEETTGTNTCGDCGATLTSKTISCPSCNAPLSPEGWD